MHLYKTVCLLLFFLFFSFLTKSYAIQTILVIDRSRSMKHTDPRNLRYDAIRMLKKIIPGRISSKAVVFNRTARVIETPEIESIPPSGGTCIQCGLKKAVSMTPRPDGIILLTDGIDTSLNIGKLVSEMKGIKIYPVGLSSSINEDVLNALAVRTGGVYIRAFRDTDLPTSFGYLSMIIRGDQCITAKRGVVLTVPVEFGAKKISIIAGMSGKTARLEIKDPSGDKQIKNPAWTLAKSQYWNVDIVSPAQGDWTISIVPSSVSADNSWIQVWAESPLHIFIESFPEKARPNQKLSPLLKVEEGNALVPAVNADAVIEHDRAAIDTIIITKAREFNFDEYSKKGGYAFQFAVPENPGDYTMQFNVTGLARGGSRFQRSILHILHVSGKAYKFNPFSDK